ncbi:MULTISPECIES: hypothetical protein [unclassified Arthrobacter]|uniref:hypothetical protein n=1 Tax=unclassified Arthrobacter TaxID=235627 RepID=UPI003397C001
MSLPDKPNAAEVLIAGFRHVVATAGSTDPSAPLVVLLHGRGSNEGEILGFFGADGEYDSSMNLTDRNGSQPHLVVLTVRPHG